MTTLVFCDSKSARGGGQVVLEHLMGRLQGAVGMALIMPQFGYESIRVDSSVDHFTSVEDYVARAEIDGERIVLVSNANSSLPDVYRLQTRLGRRADVTSVAIVHNYPEKNTKSVATRLLLKRMDTVIVVEPGLTRLSPTAVTPPWLSVYSPPQLLQPGSFERTGRVKSYARPDRSKGLHLLPGIFAYMESQGYVCEVALGDALQAQESYGSRLRDSLSRWLVAGKRSSEWIEPGDIFIVPSISGEAVCLTAQEAMGRGAFVVASRVGLLPYISPEGRGIRTFRAADVGHAVEVLRDVINLPRVEYLMECSDGNRAIRSRAGLWYDSVASRLLAIVDNEAKK